MTDYTSVLNSSVLVTGAVLASNGDCVIGSIITFNISTQDNDNEGEDIDMHKKCQINNHLFVPLIVNFTEVMSKLFNNSNVTNPLVNQLLQRPTSLSPAILQPTSTSTVLEPTDTPSSDETSGLPSDTVALIVVVVLLSVLVILILVIVGILFLSRMRR